MLRAFVIAIGVAALIGAAVVAAFRPAVWPAACELGIFGALVLLGTLFERRYRFRCTATGPQWQATGERFVDPTSGKLVEVRYDPKTGERAYVNVEDRT